MHEMPSVLTAWSNFYVITGSSAAALTGLMFVVVTLVAGDRRRAKSEGMATFSTPTVVVFCAALAVSAILSVPWRSLVHAGVMLALVGLYGVGYTVLVIRRARRLTVYQPEFEDWLWFWTLPLVAYGAIVAAAVFLANASTGALFALAAATMLLIFIGIHNSWDVVTWIAVEQFGGPGEAADTGTGAPAAVERAPEAAGNDGAG